MPTKKTVLETLFAKEAHLGHKKSRVHPKAKKYIYKIEAGTSIIDLTQTEKQLAEAINFLKKAKKENKTLLFVATKKVAAETLREICLKKGLLHITNKWPPGLLTNFQTLKKNINRLVKMDKEKESGAWNKFPKHERVKMERKLNKLKRVYEGVIRLEKLPDVLVIIDIKKEKNAVDEARKYQIPIVAVVDTNGNPDLVDYPVVANDDAVDSVQYLIKELTKVF